MRYCTLILVTILLGTTKLCAQKIKLKFQYIDESYIGTMNPKWYDEVQLTPSESKEKLDGARGIMTGDRFGTMNFSIAENQTGTEEEWMLKTNNGWYPLTKVKFTKDKIFLSFDWGFRAPIRPIDLQALERTKELLSQEESWNHDDDRRCDDDFSNSRWSLYCALKQAYLDVTRDFNHRAAGLNIVRETISVLNPDWEYKHQLMEFNNDELYADIIKLLDISIQKMDGMTKVN